MSNQYQANFEGESPDGVIKGSSEAETHASPRELSFLERIARTAHEVNRAYCEGHGDNTQVPWEMAPEWQRHSAIEGVKYFYDNPQATGEEMHNNWKAQKVAEGWIYGEVKDAVRQTHPCIVPYNKLPFSQRVKDFLFLSVVKSFVTSD
jgi:hypothetical protein